MVGLTLKIIEEQLEYTVREGGSGHRMLVILTSAYFQEQFPSFGLHKTRDAIGGEGIPGDTGTPLHLPAGKHRQPSLRAFLLQQGLPME